MLSEALTPLTPLSRGERGEQSQRKEPFSPPFSLLSLWERRAGEVRASEGRPPKNSPSLGERTAGGPHGARCEARARRQQRSHQGVPRPRQRGGEVDRRHRREAEDEAGEGRALAHPARIHSEEED